MENKPAENIQQLWNDEIDRISSDFQKAFGSASIEQLNFKPDPGTWSIAENILHLIKLNESYFPIIDLISTGKYKPSFLGRFSVLTDVFGEMIYKSVSSDNKRKMRTFTIWKPQSGQIRDVVIYFIKHQEQLKSKINDLSPADLELSISSPANSAIVYRLSKGIEIIIEHEKRHFIQAKRLLDQQVFIK